MVRATPVARGCGSRQQGGVYLESGLSPYGLTIEHFLFDPPLTVDDVGTPDWFELHREPILVERDGVHHLVIWIGAEFYPNVWDFVEETRVAGISRRVPKTFDFSKLTDRSRMFFVHREAFVQHVVGDASEIVTACCPMIGAGDVAKHPTSREPCLGLATRLDTAHADVLPYRVIGSGDDGTAIRRLPCGHSYTVPPRFAGRIVNRWPGLFLQMPITGIACITDDLGQFDQPTFDRAAKATGIDVFKAEA